MESDSNINVYKKFNSSLKFFIRQLVESFPNNKEFKVALLIYKMSKSISKKTPQKYFKDMLLIKYRSFLELEDDSFLKDDILDKSKLPLGIQLLCNELTDFYSTWEKIDAENKKIIWQHVKILIATCDKCDE
jgi:hypothetical protein